jgi:hypothetical protein
MSTQSVELSRLIWKTLIECELDWTTARYRRNRSKEYVKAPSCLHRVLTENEWIPQEGGTFVRPINALRDKLPSGFSIDAGWKWLDRIGFEGNRGRAEQEESERTEETVDEERRAQEAGFKDRESMERARRLSELLPEEELKRVLEEYERRDSKQLPNHQSPNPDRRASRVHEDGLGAPKRKYEHRSRSVLVDLDGTKKQAGEYLRHQYTDGDRIMICQVCQRELPFKLPTGEYYFERVQFLDELEKNHRENYLALCPLHAAMYMHARTSPKSLLQALKDLNGRELKVTLAEKSETICFTTNHINDIRAKVRSEENTGESYESVNEEDAE